MNLNRFEHIYFLGIGGIGMSALARYFHRTGKKVSGYDKTVTPLTLALEGEGIEVHYEDLGDEVMKYLPSKEKVLVVITPAVPKEMKEKIFFENHSFTMTKRARLLGDITAGMKTFAVAGTHGKTTTSAMLAYVLSLTTEGCNAFLGGISTNLGSNLLMTEGSDRAVVEADEFDRSFLQLRPFASILTSTDADHLDIYSHHDILKSAFSEYVNLIPAEGCLIVQKDIDLTGPINTFRYGLNTQDKAVDYRGINLRIEKDKFMMDVESPAGPQKDIVLGVHGIHNAENALAVYALCDYMGIESKIIREGLASFKGVKRRFEMIVNKKDFVYIDDYAHHPTAIESLIRSVRLIYPDLPVKVVFQPHLFSRTSDFMQGFADALDLADEVILLPIYPAREKPMEGITSEVLASKMKSENVEVVGASELADKLQGYEKGVLLTVGAGDIDRLVEPLKRHFE
ncbi:MAG: UDP-N-acetylmuramate--L-alanine ligase [Brumimicrobium sp.]|nr:UDP-N-acetylmuramate--L-alanine ligase [Brumimicrobium sp.]